MTIDAALRKVKILIEEDKQKEMAKEVDEKNCKCMESRYGKFSSWEK